MVYVDTSVLVAYYCPEALSGAAEKAIRSADLPSVSLLTQVEFCSALATKARARAMDVQVAQSVLSLFRVHVEERRYRVVPLGTKEYLIAGDWIGRFSVPLRTVDALHLAVASSNGLRLLTADRALALSAEHFGLEHRLIS